MGLLDNLAGQVLGGGGAKGNLLNAVVGLLGNQQSGGLSGLVQQFAGKGLGDIVNSWVGTGKNLPITAEQIKQGLGSDAITQLAAKAGLSPDQVTSHLSELLPNVVDKLTPNGQVPKGDIMAQGMELLKGLMK
jgi:uncharacterized protein YidB (DUF937 family)